MKGSKGMGRTDERDCTQYVRSDAHSNNKGITLVALVITIIILLILAGITINLTIGQRGILKRAEEAGKNYQEVAGKEDEELRKLDNIIAGTDISNEPKITMVDGVPVPKGFEHIEGTKEDGFVIKDVSVDEEGKPTSTNGNEFVWIPCTEDGKNGSIKYDRYAFSKNGWEFSQTKNEETEEITWSAYGMTYSFTEVMPRIELNSMKQYGGFYIGRYEVGVVDYDINVETSNTNNEKEWTGYHNGRAVIQENKQVWNYITRDKAKKVAEGMYTENTDVISRLCSSYGWDTALKFIETKNVGYATSNVEENNSRDLKNTGKTIGAASHIYDMKGNATEWTTEFSHNNSYCCTGRGRNFGINSNSSPAGNRVDLSETDAYDYLGFRMTLYLSL